MKKSNSASALPNGMLSKIIEEGKQKFLLDPEFKISKHTIYLRLQKDRNLESFGKGPKSPMASIKGIIMVIAKEKAKINQPLTPTEGLQLKN